MVLLMYSNTSLCFLGAKFYQSLSSRTLILKMHGHAPMIRHKLWGTKQLALLHVKRIPIKPSGAEFTCGEGRPPQSCNLTGCPPFIHGFTSNCPWRRKENGSCHIISLSGVP